MRLRSSHLLRSERGTTTIEFTILALLLLWMVFLIFEFGRGIWIYNNIAHGAREGTRFAIVRGEDSGRPTNATAVQNYVRARTGMNSLQVTTTWHPNLAFGSEVQVQVSYNFVPVVFPARIPALTLTSTSRMVISF